MYYAIVPIDIWGGREGFLRGNEGVGTGWVRFQVSTYCLAPSTKSSPKLDIIFRSWCSVSLSMIMEIGLDGADTAWKN